MAQPVTFKPSRTFALAAFGLLVLALVAVGLFAVLAWSLVHPLEGFPELPGHLVTALQVVAGCIATVATAGAGSMAARDWRSGGLTSSQGYQVLAARGLPEAPPQAARPAPASPTAVPQALVLGWAWWLLAGVLAAAGVLVMVLAGQRRRRPGELLAPYQAQPGPYLEASHQELERARQDEVAEVLSNPDPDARTADLARLLERWDP